VVARQRHLPLIAALASAFGEASAASALNPEKVHAASAAFLAAVGAFFVSAHPARRDLGAPLAAESF